MTAYAQLINNNYRLVSMVQYLELHGVVLTASCLITESPCKPSESCRLYRLFMETSGESYPIRASWLTSCKSGLHGDYLSPGLHGFCMLEAIWKQVVYFIRCQPPKRISSCFLRVLSRSIWRAPPTNCKTR